MDKSLTTLFRKAVKKHFHTLRELLSDQDVFPGQPSLLFTLHDQDGQSQKELAEKLNNKPATITVMIHRMEKNGLVERRSDERDQRMTRVFLTPKGKIAHDAVSEAMTVMESLCFSNFTADEKLLFEKLLQKMIHNINSAQFERGE